MQIFFTASYNIQKDEVKLTENDSLQSMTVLFILGGWGGGGYTSSFPGKPASTPFAVPVFLHSVNIQCPPHKTVCSRLHMSMFALVPNLSL